MLPNHIIVFGNAIPIFSLMAFIGIVAAYTVAIFRTERFGISFLQFLILCTAALGGMIFGSKLLHLLTVLYDIREFSFSNILLAFVNSGFVFYGGLLGAIFALIVCSKILRRDIASVINVFVLSFPLFHFFGRIGCFFAGCCYGLELKESFKLVGIIYINKIPTQLFEAVFELILFFILLVIDSKCSGLNLLKIYLLTYATFRFANEFFRGDEIRGIFLLSTAQWISLVIVAYYAIKWLIKPKSVIQVME